MGCYLQLVRAEALLQYRLELICFAIQSPYIKDPKPPQLPEILRD